jgi:hypothetical protein
MRMIVNNITQSTPSLPAPEIDAREQVISALQPPPDGLLQV